MTKIEESSSFSKGFKFAAGVIVFLAIFLFFFRPQLVIGPVDSEGNIMVPKGTKENTVYSSVPLKEIKKSCPLNCNDWDECTKDYCSESTNYQCKNDPVIPCCGNNKCEEKETYSNCNVDCAMLYITINSLESTKDLRDKNFYGSFKPDSTMEDFYYPTLTKGNIFFIIDLTLENRDVEDVTVSMAEFLLKDSFGKAYDSITFDRKPTNIYGLENLGEVEKIQGKIAFIIPEESNNFILKHGKITSYKHNKNEIEFKVEYEKIK